MGVPYGHPFFGNQYTNGGYIPGTFKYVPDMAETIIKNSSRLVSDKIGKTVSEMVTRPKPMIQILKVPNTKGFDLNILIAGGLALGVFTGGYLFYKFKNQKTKAEKFALQPIELSYVGICTNCGEPLSESTYVPESETDNQVAYIICNECGEKNFANFANENGPSEKVFLDRNEQVFEEISQINKQNLGNLINGENKMISFGCSNRCGVDMEYIGDGDWKCPKCGEVSAIGEPDDLDYEDAETLSIYDAALIYLSRGFDEDYRFGYTHEELIEALKD